MNSETVTICLHHKGNMTWQYGKIAGMTSRPNEAGEPRYGALNRNYFYTKYVENALELFF